MLAYSLREEMITLTDDETAIVLKHLARNNETKSLHARLNAYLNGYEYDIHAVYDGMKTIAVYRRGTIVASIQFDDTDNVRDVLARLGYPRARKRHNPR